MNCLTREQREQSYFGFSNREFRERLTVGKAYRIKDPIGKDDSHVQYIRAKLLAIYPTYGLFDTGKYKIGPTYFNLANGDMK